MRFGGFKVSIATNIVHKLIKLRKFFAKAHQAKSESDLKTLNLKKVLESELPGRQHCE